RRRNTSRKIRRQRDGSSSCHTEGRAVMAKRAKTAKKRSTRTTSRAAVSRYKAVSGRGVAGEAWDPSQPQAEAALAIQEINEPAAVHQSVPNSGRTFQGA